MAIKRIELENFTVFSNLDITFSEGINLLIGNNGYGKTHIMKLIYGACKAVKHDVSFSEKVTRIFMPEKSSINRLVNRNIKTGTAHIKVYSDSTHIGMDFTTRTKKWAAIVSNEEKWEKQSGDFESTFIPAKEILSNSKNLTEAVSKGNVYFDDTYIDIIAAAKIDISHGRNSYDRQKYLDMLMKITNGKVTIEDETFYLKPGNQSKIEFNLVAEGVRKLALLWQLIKNGTLEKGSILFWDEPEANINPVNIEIITKMLLQLQRNGVQIFIATHNYFFAKYIELQRSENDKISYYSFYKDDNKNILCEIGNKFEELAHNSIMETFVSLYKGEMEKAMK